MHQKDDELIQATATADELTVLSRTSLVAVAASFLLIGVAASVYGPLLAVLSHRFAISLPVAGQVFSAHFARALLGVLVINCKGCKRAKPPGFCRLSLGTIRIGG